MRVCIKLDLCVAHADLLIVQTRGGQISFY